MKVALLSDCYLPRLGGIEVQVHDLAARLRERGHEVSVFTATPGPQGERAGVVDRVDGVPVHRLALRLPFELPVNPLAPPEVRRRLPARRVRRRARAHGGGEPVRRGRRPGHDGHGAADGHDLALHARSAGARPAGGRVRRPLGRAGRGHERGLRGSRRPRCSASSARPGRCTVLPNGIDVARWAAAGGCARAARRRRRTGIRLVSAMRLAGRKRPLQLLRVVRRVRELAGAAVPLHLDVLGEGPQRGRLERYVARHGLEGVVSLPGRVAREELPRAVRRRGHLHRPRPAGVLRHRRPGGADGRAPGRRPGAAAASRSSCRTGSTGTSPPTTRRWRARVARLVARRRPARRAWPRTTGSTRRSSRGTHVVAGAEAEYERARSLAGVR